MTRFLSLEGTVRSSKSVLACQLFFLKVIASKHDLHCIACQDLDAVNDNFVTGATGLLTLYPGQVKLKKDKIGSNYLQIKGIDGTYKKVLLAGYGDVSKWKKILGKSIEVFLIDEFDLCNKQFFDESLARQIATDAPLTIVTQNGNDPKHWTYQEYINRCEPLFPNTTPDSILKDMNLIENKEGYYYSHWTFKDNPAMTDEKIEAALDLFPKGSYYYKIKIMGERGKTTGTIFLSVLTDENLIESQDINWNNYELFRIGIDVGGGNDEIGKGDATVFTLTGFNFSTKRMLSVKQYYHKNGVTDNIKKGTTEYIEDFVEWFKPISMKVGGRLEVISVDSANKTFRLSLANKLEGLGFYDKVLPSNKKTIKQRVAFGILMLNTNRWQISNECPELIKALQNATYNEKPNGKDLRTEDSSLDPIDSNDYTFTKYMGKLS